MSRSRTSTIFRLSVFVAFFVYVVAAEVKHFNNLIVGAGPAGLYTAYRLSSEGGRQNETTAIYEWSPVRHGGRIFTKTFSRGQHLELGGMRFTEENRILQKLLDVLDLRKHVTEFPMTDNRLYYIRGTHIYESCIPENGVPCIPINGVPYKTHIPEFRKMLPSKLFNMVAERVLNEFNPNTTADWCRFFDTGVLPSTFNSSIYHPGDFVGNIGYWNLMLDQLGSEAFHYVTDAGGYTSNVINKNAAKAVQSNSELIEPVKFKTLDKGYSYLFQKLVEKIKGSVPITYGQRLTKFHWNAKEKKFHCTFETYDENGIATGAKTNVTSDKLFLCMPKKSIDMIHENDVVGLWLHPEPKVLKNTKGRLFIESIIQQPAYKIGLLYDKPWWLEADIPPFVDTSLQELAKNGNLNYGPTVTDLPIRQIYYMGNNAPNSSNYFGILASYDDTQFPKFWRVLEQTPKENASKPMSEDFKPLFEGTPVTDAMLDMVQKQLSLVHYNSTDKDKVPKPIEGFYVNWDLNPYGAGYHAWKAHYSIGEAQYFMTRPGKEFGVPLYIAGSAYSNIQGWVEGAFDTAESILIEEIGLDPITDFTNYTLICKPNM